jgi:hypothetical protein
MFLAKQVRERVMRALVVLAALSITTLSGCIGEWFVIRTVEEIKRSDARAEYISPKSPDIVTSCMMQTLYSHTNAKGERPYAGLTTHEFGTIQYAELTSQTFGTMQSITLRVTLNPMIRGYGGEGELLFLIENSVRDGGAKSSVWVNQNFLSPSPKKYLGTLVEVVRGCL